MNQVRSRLLIASGELGFGGRSKGDSSLTLALWRGDGESCRLESLNLGAPVTTPSDEVRNAPALTRRTGAFRVSGETSRQD